MGHTVQSVQGYISEPSPDLAHSCRSLSHHFDVWLNPSSLSPLSIFPCSPEQIQVAIPDEDVGTWCPPCGLGPGPSPLWAVWLLSALHESWRRGGRGSAASAPRQCPRGRVLGPCLSRLPWDSCGRRTPRQPPPVTLRWPTPSHLFVSSFLYVVCCVLFISLFIYICLHWNRLRDFCFTIVYNYLLSSILLLPNMP